MIVFDKVTYITLLVVQGAITAIYGFFIASISSDLKRIMSYSSLGYYGVMTAVLGLLPLNRELLTNIALVYVVYHGITKILVFINIASIELLTNTRDVYKLGYLAQVSRRLYDHALIAFLSLAGAPPTLGFLAKFTLLVLLLSAIPSAPHLALPMVFTLSFAFVLAIVYSVKYLSTYTAMYRSKPTRGAIDLVNVQILSERIATIANILLPLPMYVILGVRNSYDIVALAIYAITLILLTAFIIQRNRVERKEKIVWIGGVEV